jgi:transcriptional regulator with XRE-family HTH domain
MATMRSTMQSTASATPMILTAARPVGRLLQEWRQVRRKSQLDLAMDAGISTRHLSFVESGRANPSRDMVLLLAETLQVPFRERNELLTAAGFAAIYRDAGLGAPDLAQARKAIDLILKHQEPYPAVVMDRHWNLLDSNEAAQRLFAFLLDGSAPPGPPNVIRLMFHPAGVRRWVSNWESVAASLIHRMHREAVGGAPDDATRKLLDEAATLAGVPQRLIARGMDGPVLPLFPVQFRKDDLAMDFFSMVTTLGTPRDVTLQEIRIECFFPANEATEKAARIFADG